MFTPTLTSLSGWITTTCASLGATGRPLLAPSDGAEAAGSSGESDRSVASPLGTDGEVALVCSPAAAEAAGLPLASRVGAETGAEVAIVASITGIESTTADRSGVGMSWGGSGQCRHPRNQGPRQHEEFAAQSDGRGPLHHVDTSKLLSSQQATRPVGCRFAARGPAVLAHRWLLVTGGR